MPLGLALALLVVVTNSWGAPWLYDSCLQSRACVGATATRDLHHRVPVYGSVLGFSTADLREFGSKDDVMTTTHDL